MLFFMLIGILFVKQKTAYEMRISDWSSDVCSSDLSASWRSSARSGVVTRRRTPAGEAVRGRGAAAEPPLRRETGAHQVGDRKSVVEGKSVSVRVDLGGGRIMTKKTQP